MKKIIGFLLLIIVAVVAYFGYQFYKKNYTDNVAKEGYILIPHQSKFEAIIDSISPYLKDKEAFVEVAKAKNMNRFFNAGRYRIRKGTNNTDLVNMIKAGNQTDLPFRIGAFGNVYTMIGRVARKTEIDSLTFIKGLHEIAINKGYQDAEDLKKYFFIDTYNFFWTVTPEAFFQKFEKQYNEFWTPENIAKEKELGLTREQIYALASIVYKESGGKPDEMKTIAGLYLNRYEKGMKLQSDPTVIYAIQKDKGFHVQIKRVLNRHLKYNSPYNTYANKGIPPAPICITDKNSVLAVLNAEENDYIYMCADPENWGFHKFTKSSIEHQANAKKYQNWLTQKQREQNNKKK
ncbi:MAG: aminodeoxychorismate lyase [Flavobacteriales bacterium]|nr:MAG: aminodeoxychorismate lyase [Flavobacteriales bacterium]